MTDFAWLIEAPGTNYLGAREIGHLYDFYWTKDHNAALRFFNAKQADMVMMVAKRLCPELFAFAVNLGEARPVEHGWFAQPTPPAEVTEAIKTVVDGYDAYLNEFTFDPKSIAKDIAAIKILRAELDRREASHERKEP